MLIKLYNFLLKILYSHNCVIAFIIYFCVHEICIYSMKNGIIEILLL